MPELNHESFLCGPCFNENRRINAGIIWVRPFKSKPHLFTIPNVPLYLLFYENGVFQARIPTVFGMCYGCYCIRFAKKNAELLKQDTARIGILVSSSLRLAHYFHKRSIKK